MCEENNPRKAGSRKPYYCGWQQGDVFALQIVDKWSARRGVAGRWLLFQTVNGYRYSSGTVIPEVYVKMTNGPELPQSSEEYDSLEYIQTGFMRYVNRLWYLINPETLKEDIVRRRELVYEPDEWGFLRYYRAHLMLTSRNRGKEYFTFIGNYASAKPPLQEFIPEDRIFFPLIEPEEERRKSSMVECYFLYNQKESRIYRN